MPTSTPSESSAARLLLNTWNLLGVALTLAVAAATQDVWILAAGGAVESLWLAVGSQSPRIQRALRARLEPRRRDRTLRTTQDEIRLLPAAERSIVQRVASSAAEIRDECHRNPRLAGELLAPDLERLEQTIADYVHLAVLAHRCDLYLARAEAEHIARERDDWRRRAVSDPDEAERALAHQNVVVLEKRIGLMDDIQRFVTRARAQMALVQNSVALVRDEVLTLSTPRTVTQELDNLVNSLEAIREATREVEDAIILPLPQQPTLSDPMVAFGEGAKRQGLPERK